MSLASTPQAISRTSCIGSPVLPAAGSSVASVGRAGGPDLRARVGSELGVDGRRSCFLNVLKLRSGKHRQPSAGAHLMSQHASGRRRGGGAYSFGALGELALRARGAAFVGAGPAPVSLSDASVVGPPAVPPLPTFARRALTMAALGRKKGCWPGRSSAV